MKQPKKAPTMSDVARLTGVSSMTVSRAFRDDASVSKETRDKIRKAAEKLGYVIDSTASGLSSRKTGFVAVIIPSINNANFADTLRGLTEGLRTTNLPDPFGLYGLRRAGGGASRRAVPAPTP